MELVAGESEVLGNAETVEFRGTALPSRAVTSDGWKTLGSHASCEHSLVPKEVVGASEQSGLSLDT